MEIKKFIKENQLLVSAVVVTTGMMALSYFSKDSEAVSMAKQAFKLKNLEHAHELDKLDMELQITALKAVEHLTEGDKGSLLTAAALNKVARNYSAVEDTLEDILDQVEKLTWEARSNSR